MLWLRWLLMGAAAGALLVAVVEAVRDARRLRRGEALRMSRRHLLLPAAVVAFVLARAIVVVPSGMAGVRVSQVSGTLPGTLFPGPHFVRPLTDDVVLYDTHERILTTEG